MRGIGRRIKARKIANIASYRCDKCSYSLNKVTAMQCTQCGGSYCSKCYMGHSC